MCTSAERNREGVTVDLEDNSKVSKRDIYNRLCACRDFEIKLQWERAVFLTAFLIACFAGYGGFVLSVHQNGSGSLSPFLVSAIPVCICFVGIILSLFWIMMAKGSKAWYEHYESAIAAFSRSGDVGSGVDENLLAHNLIRVPNIMRSSMSDSVFRLTGGCYSVSKIVIGIGILSLGIWSALFIGHLLIWLLGPISTWMTGYLGKLSCAVTAFVACIALLGITTWVTNCMRSTYLKAVELLLQEDGRPEVKVILVRTSPLVSDAKIKVEVDKNPDSVYLVIRRNELKCFDSEWQEVEKTKWKVEKFLDVVLHVRVKFGVKVVEMKKTEVMTCES